MLYLQIYNIKQTILNYFKYITQIPINKAIKKTAPRNWSSFIYLKNPIFLKIVPYRNLEYITIVGIRIDIMSIGISIIFRNVH